MQKVSIIGLKLLKLQASYIAVYISIGRVLCGHTVTMSSVKLLVVVLLLNLLRVSSGQGKENVVTHAQIPEMVCKPL